MCGISGIFNLKESAGISVEILKNMMGEYPWVLLVLSLILLMLSLVFMVKSLKRLVVEKTEAWFDRHLFKNARRAFLVGIILTSMVQSSSITTSLVVPMAGAREKGGIKFVASA